jgi:hypothetical protein
MNLFVLEKKLFNLQLDESNRQVNTFFLYLLTQIVFNLFN